eukprot:Rmarinus@m.823
MSSECADAASDSAVQISTLWSKYQRELRLKQDSNPVQPQSVFLGPSSRINAPPLSARNMKRSELFARLERMRTERRRARAFESPEYLARVSTDGNSNVSPQGSWKFRSPSSSRGHSPDSGRTRHVATPSRSSPSSSLPQPTDTHHSEIVEKYLERRRQARAALQKQIDDIDAISPLHSASGSGSDPLLQNLHYIHDQRPSDSVGRPDNRGDSAQSMHTNRGSPTSNLNLVSSPPGRGSPRERSPRERESTCWDKKSRNSPDGSVSGIENSALSERRLEGGDSNENLSSGSLKVNTPLLGKNTGLAPSLGYQDQTRLSGQSSRARSSPRGTWDRLQTKEKEKGASERRSPLAENNDRSRPFLHGRTGSVSPLEGSPRGCSPLDKIPRGSSPSERSPPQRSPKGSSPQASSAYCSPSGSVRSSCSYVSQPGPTLHSTSTDPGAYKRGSPVSNSVADSPGALRRQRMMMETYKARALALRRQERLEMMIREEREKERERDRVLERERAISSECSEDSDQGSRSGEAYDSEGHEGDVKSTLNGACDPPIENRADFSQLPENRRHPSPNTPPSNTLSVAINHGPRISKGSRSSPLRPKVLSFEGASADGDHVGHSESSPGESSVVPKESNEDETDDLRDSTDTLALERIGNEVLAVTATMAASFRSAPSSPDERRSPQPQPRRTMGVLSTSVGTSMYERTDDPEQSPLRSSPPYTTVSKRSSPVCSQAPSAKSSPALPSPLHPTHPSPPRTILTDTSVSPPCESSETPVSAAPTGATHTPASFRTTDAPATPRTEPAVGPATPPIFTRPARYSPRRTAEITTTSLASLPHDEAELAPGEFVHVKSEMARKRLFLRRMQREQWQGRLSSAEREAYLCSTASPTTASPLEMDASTTFGAPPLAKPSPAAARREANRTPDDVACETASGMRTLYNRSQPGAGREGRAARYGGHPRSFQRLPRDLEPRAFRMKAECGGDRSSAVGSTGDIRRSSNVRSIGPRHAGVGSPRSESSNTVSSRRVQSQSATALGTSFFFPHAQSEPGIDRTRTSHARTSLGAKDTTPHGLLLAGAAPVPVHRPSSIPTTGESLSPTHKVISPTEPSEAFIRDDAQVHRGGREALSKAPSAVSTQSPTEEEHNSHVLDSPLSTPRASLSLPRTPSRSPSPSPSPSRGHPRPRSPSKPGGSKWRLSSSASRSQPSTDTPLASPAKAFHDTPHRVDLRDSLFARWNPDHDSLTVNDTDALLTGDGPSPIAAIPSSESLVNHDFVRLVGSQSSVPLSSESTASFLPPPPPRFTGKSPLRSNAQTLHSARPHSQTASSTSFPLDTTLPVLGGGTSRSSVSGSVPSTRKSIPLTTGAIDFETWQSASGSFASTKRSIKTSSSLASTRSKSNAVARSLDVNSAAAERGARSNFQARFEAESGVHCERKAAAPSPSLVAAASAVPLPDSASGVSNNERQRVHVNESFVSTTRLLDFSGYAGDDSDTDDNDNDGSICDRLRGLGEQYEHIHSTDDPHIHSTDDPLTHQKSTQIVRGKRDGADALVSGGGRASFVLSQDDMIEAGGSYNGTRRECARPNGEYGSLGNEPTNEAMRDMHEEDGVFFDSARRTFHVTHRQRLSPRNTGGLQQRQASSPQSPQSPQPFYDVLQGL